MKLADLCNYDKIYIQTHDNPDADAIASGFGLYTFFKARGKEVTFFYSGTNLISKSNLKIMVKKLNIPLKYKEPSDEKIDGLLITVDCQWGAGNVTKFEAEKVAIIDHHQIENEDVELSNIQSNLGACSTLVWTMLSEERFPINDNLNVCTALYYGLYSDTNQFAEIHNPSDKDMRDEIPYNSVLIHQLNNSNISLKELEVAGIAMIRTIHNDDYNYAIIKAQPCDPNILGLISDFLLQVDQIWTCVVYMQNDAGFKFSVRSCIKEVNANELAAFIAGDIGSGGGHIQKAGGFISIGKYEEKYPTLHSEAYFSEKMNEYFESFEIIYAEDYKVDINKLQSYRKIKRPQGYVVANEVFPNKTPIKVRTLEGDMDLIVEPDLIIMIGIRGEVYPNRKGKFEHTYEIISETCNLEECTVNMTYEPTVINRITGEKVSLSEYAHTCRPSGETHIHAKQINKSVKIFTAWDENKYMLGYPGDYLAVRSDDVHDIYIVAEDIFPISYEPFEEVEKHGYEE